MLWLVQLVSVERDPPRISLLCQSMEVSQIVPRQLGTNSRGGGGAGMAKWQKGNSSPPRMRRPMGILAVRFSREEVAGEQVSFEIVVTGI